MILPASQAGNWGSNVGLPADSNYYLGLSPNKPKPGIAGKYSYDHDPVDGAANIIAYSLGKGIEYMIKRGPSQQQYKDIMNDMIKQLNCQLGYVNIDNQGQLTITSKPFGNLDFDFDYHAPSHIAGNNRPGFMIVPPNKGDVGKKKRAPKSSAETISAAGDKVPDIVPDLDLDVASQKRSDIKAYKGPVKIAGDEKTLGRKRRKP